MAYYQRLERMLDDHPNPEVGHYMERAWGAVFWPYEAECFYAYEPERPEPVCRTWVPWLVAVALALLLPCVWVLARRRPLRAA